MNLEKVGSLSWTLFFDTGTKCQDTHWNQTTSFLYLQSFRYVSLSDWVPFLWATRLVVD